MTEPPADPGEPSDQDGLFGANEPFDADGPTATGGQLAAAPPVAGSGRRRTVLWATVAVAVGVSVLVAVIASSQPSSKVTARSLLLGRPAPAIAGPALGAGRRYSLAGFRGKWVLVNFMATWCTACQQEMPQLAAFAREHSADADATVLTVVYDPSDVARLRGFLAAHGATWPAVNDPAASVSYGVTGLPSSFLVDPSGYIYAYVPGEVTASEVNGWIKQAAAKGLGGA